MTAGRAMSTRHFRVFLVSLALANTGLSCAAWGQNFPSKIVRIVTTEVGGGNDFVARAIAPLLSKNLGQQVVIDNRGIIAATIAAKAPPDGHTLLFFGASLWIAPLFQDQVQWDAEKDFSPVTLAVNFPNILAVHPSLPVRTAGELIALAKAKPGELNYSSGATLGASPFLAAELFKSMAGVKITRVNYKGGGQALNGLLTGEVHLMFPNAGSISHLMKSGRLKALAITTAKRSPLAPGLPALSEFVPGYESVASIAVLAPAKTPAAIIAILNKEITEVLNLPEVKNRFLENGTIVAASSPEELAGTIRTEKDSWARLIRTANLRPQ